MMFRAMFCGAAFGLATSLALGLEPMTFEDIEIGQPLPYDVGATFTLQDPPPPPEDAPTAQEQAEMEAAGTPYIDPRPVKLNLRFVENRYTVIFLNAQDQVTGPIEVSSIVVDAERLNDDGDHFEFALRLDPTGTYYFHPRFIHPPLRYRTRLLVERPAPPPPFPGGPVPPKPMETYGTLVINQLAQENELGL